MAVGSDENVVNRHNLILGLNKLYCIEQDDDHENFETYLLCMYMRIYRGILTMVIINEPNATDPMWWRIRCEIDLQIAQQSKLLSLKILRYKSRSRFLVES